jgi:hypothetical protein
MLTGVKPETLGLKVECGGLRGTSQTPRRHQPELDIGVGFGPGLQRIAKCQVILGLGNAEEAGVGAPKEELNEILKFKVTKFPTSWNELWPPSIVQRPLETLDGKNVPGTAVFSVKYTGSSPRPSAVTRYSSLGLAGASGSPANAK